MAAREEQAAALRDQQAAVKTRALLEMDKAKVAQEAAERKADVLERQRTAQLQAVAAEKVATYTGAAA